MSGEDGAHLMQSLEFIRTQEGLMRKALSQQGRLLVAIKHASSMLGELRTSSLTPKQYYELYTACFDALAQLGSYMREDHRNHHLADVYEIVQYTGNVLPRLYLMITVGTAFLSTPDAPVHEILKDMLEMCRGVQHPVRGLFLRYYLGQLTRAFLPTSTPRELQSSINFTLTNFIEMNKLWVRLQHVGHSRDRPKRTRERRELQIIVGSNVLRLAQLDGVDSGVFKTQIWPRLAEQVVQCRDPLAQEYLLDVVCQAFPAEFHLATLESYLKVLHELSPNSSLRLVLLASIQRVRGYAEDCIAEKQSVDKESSAKKAVEEVNDGTSDSRVTETMPESEDKGGAEDQEGSVGQSDNHGSLDSGNSTITSTSIRGSDPADSTANSTRKGSSEVDETPQQEHEHDHDNQQEPEESHESTQEETRESMEDNSLGSEAPDQGSHKDNPPKEAPTNEPSTQANAITETLDKSWADLQTALELYGQVLPNLTLPLADKAAIVEPLSRLAHILGYDDQVEGYIAFVAASSSERPPSKQDGDVPLNADVEHLLISLFDYIPLLQVLALLQKHSRLLESQNRTIRERIAGRVLIDCVASGTTISNYNTAQQIFDLFVLLLKNGDADPLKLAELIHLLGADSKIDTLKLLQLAHRSLREGGAQVVRQTYGCVAGAAIKLLSRPGSSEDDALILKFINKTIHDLATIGDLPELAFRFYVLAAACSDARGHEEATYELWVQAFVVYEESISDSRAQFSALAMAIGTLQQATKFARENYETLASRATLYGQKLLRKEDQCHAVLLASHLWLPESERLENSEKLLETLQRALRIADSTMDSTVSLELFCDVFDRYAYFLLLEVPSVTLTDVVELVRLIRKNLDATTETGSASRRLKETLEYLNGEGIELN